VGGRAAPVSVVMGIAGRFGGSLPGVPVMLAHDGRDATVHGLYSGFAKDAGSEDHAIGFLHPRAEPGSVAQQPGAGGRRQDDRTLLVDRRLLKRDLIGVDRVLRGAATAARAAAPGAALVPAKHGVTRVEAGLCERPVPRAAFTTCVMEDEQQGIPVGWQR